ncbi:histidine phosphatase family protein [Streptomyces sp. JNUCC 64]
MATTTRVTLVTPVIGRDLREARFAGDGPLDPAALTRARTAGHALPYAPRWFRSPTARCHETARALSDGAARTGAGAGTGTSTAPDAPDPVSAPAVPAAPDSPAAAPVAPANAPHGRADAAGPEAPAALAALDVGRWRGRTLAEVAAADPAALALWTGDPAATPHGGESLRDLRLRVGDWLDGLTIEGGRVLAVVEPDVVRAALAHALDLPGPAFWRLDAAPLTAVELSGRSGRWNVHPGRPLG